MHPPELPKDEPERLASLRSLRLLDTPAEERFDLVTRIAKRLFDVPIALISLVDEDRQWFKSKQGLTACETGRDISFCGHAILGDEPYVIEDAAVDPRFAANPLVTGEPHIRFYAGHPLRDREGRRLGTLCLIDRKPRRFGAPELRALRDLAEISRNELLSTAAGPLDMVSDQAADDLRSLVDPATGLWNEDGMREVLRVGFTRALESREPCALVRFHLELPPGIAALGQIRAEVAQVARAHLPVRCAGGTWGERGFLVALVESPRLLVETYAKDVCRDVREHPVLGAVGVDVRCGWALSSPEEPYEADELTRLAEAALERAVTRTA